MNYVDAIALVHDLNYLQSGHDKILLKKADETAINRLSYQRILLDPYARLMYAGLKTRSLISLDPTPNTQTADKGLVDYLKNYVRRNKLLEPYVELYADL